MKRIVIFCLFFICSIAGRTQINIDSCSMEISLLTCSPGTDLYSIFGHTAIRVRDSIRGMDIVYNYGTFDDSDPLFYVHFTHGIMNYSLSAETMDTFMMEYEFEHREVVAQILQLNCSEKIQLYEALRKNTLDENRIYQYHFHTDNCTTRAGKIIEANTKEPVVYKNILSVPGPSFREMIHEYLDRGHQNWSKFGIDIMLGKNLDIKPTNVEAIHFLPDYLFRGFDSAQKGNKTLVKNKLTLLSFKDQKITEGRFFAVIQGIIIPMTVFLGIFLVSLFLQVSIAKKAVRNLLIFDIIFFSLLGLLGFVMAYAWLGRVDNVCTDNINILWALPTHLLIVFFLRKNSSWIKYYFLVTAILALVLLLGFPWWPQHLNNAILPLLGIILFRSYHHFQKRNHAEKSVVQKPDAGI